MGTRAYRAIDIKGLSPAVESTQSEDLFALSGSNYIFDTKGPKSIFGNRLLLPHPIGSPAYTQGIRIRVREVDRCFTIVSDAILEWNEVLGGWDVICVIPDTSEAPYRWTWGYLNFKIYFCHPRTGILVYDINTGFCVPLVGPGVPIQPIAITINQGFVIAITPTVFANSAPNDGTNWTPELSGSGFQVIGDRVPGYPIMVTSYTHGCLTWTTGGVMRSEFTGDSAVYRHRALQTEYRPVNSFCTCRVDDDSVIVLDERGLFKSRGDDLTPYAPLFNEFLAQYIQDNDLKSGQNIRLEWDELKRLMFVSVSLSYADPLYEQCFVLYSNLDKWGQFNESHYGIIPLLVHTSSRADDYFGFVDSQGAIRYWLNTGSRETMGVETAGPKRSANLYYPPVQKPFNYIEGESGTVLSASGVANTFNDIVVTQPAGYYPFDGSALLAPESKQQTQTKS